jgi:CRISPR/Cas system-associated endoribonuclease Cas2
VQKSVFIAPRLTTKQLARLRADLARANKPELQNPGDSILLLPLPEDYVRMIEIFGNNNIFSGLAPLPPKIFL